MPEYRRAFQPGGTFFFTVVTHQRRPFLCEETARTCLRNAFHEVRAALPFDIPAIVLLPDHVHTIWRLPINDADFSTRWSRIKRGFTQRWLKRCARRRAISESRARHRERGVWQRRFWEHAIRDEHDLRKHVEYIHYNPVRHGVANCPHAWPYSSFARWVALGYCAADWQCVCDGRAPHALELTAMERTAGE